MSNLMIEKLSKIIGEEYLIENYSYHKVCLKHKSCGTIFYRSSNEIKKGSFYCKNCYIRNSSIPLKDMVKNEDSSYELVSKDFNGMHSYSTIRHSCGKEYKVTLYSFITLHGSRCDCNKDVMQPILEKDFRKYLNTYYKDIFTFNNGKIRDARCNHSYSISPEEFITGNKICKICNSYNNYYNIRKKTSQISEEINLLTNGKYTLKSNYVNNKIKIDILHKTCGKSFKMRPNDFISNSNRCPHCRNNNKTGNKFLKFIDSLEKKFSIKKEIKFKECKYKRSLPFDVGIMNNGEVIALIEFNGKQHYENSFGNETKFKEQLIRDRIKIEFCKEYQIPLFIVSYKATLKEFNNIIKEIQDLINEQV